jgi:hypothetical protein
VQACFLYICVLYVRANTIYVIYIYICSLCMCSVVCQNVLVTLVPLYSKYNTFVLYFTLFSTLYSKYNITF